MKKLLLLILLIVTAAGAYAAKLVEGTVYLKDGTVIECRGKDRIEMPRRKRPLKIMHNAFAGRRDRKEETFAASAVDSVVCHHPKAPKHRRRLIPTPKGWCWIYMQTPRLQVLVYSKKGYTLEANGGIRVLRGRHSKAVFYLRKQGGGLLALGNADGKPGDLFRRRVAACIEDDAATVQRILRSSTSRSKTLLLLESYTPGANR